MRNVRKESNLPDPERRREGLEAALFGRTGCGRRDPLLAPVDYNIGGGENPLNSRSIISANAIVVRSSM